MKSTENNYSQNTDVEENKSSYHFDEEGRV
jgi:hypothetical protein